MMTAMTLCLFGCVRFPIELKPEKIVVVAGEQEKSMRPIREAGKAKPLLKKKSKKVRKKRKPARLKKTGKKTSLSNAASTPKRISLSEQSKAEKVSRHSIQVSLFLKDIPSNVALRALANLVDVNIVLSEKVAEKRLSLHLVQVPWHDALSSITHMLNLHAWESRGVVHITANTENSVPAKGRRFVLPGNNEVRTELFQLRHSDPAVMRQTLHSLFGGKNKKNALQVAVYAPTRSLIVKGSAKDLEVVAAVITETDVPTKQILIEAYIVEAGEDFEHILGSRLGYKSSDGSENFYLTGVAGNTKDDNRPLVLGDNRNLIVDAAVEGPVWGLGLLLDRRRLKLELTALEREGNTRIISSPRIYSLNNREAMIFQGDEVPYSTVSDQGTRTEFKQAGIRLAVTPSIIDDEKMILDVVVNKDTVDKRISNPPISRREIRNRLLAKNNSVVVIGGIFFKTEIDSHTFVPILGKIPVFGNLFGRKRKEKDSRELVVFILPRIIS